MGWLDNLWRRRRARTTETPRDTAAVRESRSLDASKSAADELEDDVAEERDDVIMREPRLPPGTG